MEKQLRQKDISEFGEVWGEAGKAGRMETTGGVQKKCEQEEFKLMRPSTFQEKERQNIKGEIGVEATYEWFVERSVWKMMKKKEKRTATESKDTFWR